MWSFIAWVKVWFTMIWLTGHGLSIWYQIHHFFFSGQLQHSGKKWYLAMILFRRSMHVSFYKISSFPKIHAHIFSIWRYHSVNRFVNCLLLAIYLDKWSKGKVLIFEQSNSCIHSDFVEWFHGKLWGHTRTKPLGFFL